MKLLISLLVYNQLEVTKKCIASVLEKSTSDYHLIISDNASRKETADYLSKIDHPKVTYLRNEENLGFSTAHNNVFGLDIPSDYFCVLNNDIIIESEGWDSIFISYMENNKGLAQIGPRQDLGYLTKDGMGRDNFGRPIDYIGGSCFIVDRELVNQSGGLFEDRYMKFAFCEDADLSLRLRAHGYKIGTCVKTKIKHLHNQSFKNEKVDIDFRKLEQKNKAFLIDRWKKYLSNRNFEPMKILIIRDGAIGDTFCIEPIIRELTVKYTKCKIYVQTMCGVSLIKNPNIEEIGRNMRTRHKYDKIIDLNMSYEYDPLKHIVDAYAELANVILDSDKKIPVYYDLPVMDKDSLSEAIAINDMIVVNSEGSWESRTWNMDRWKQFINHLGKSYKIVEVGSNPKSYLGIGDNFIGKRTLQETIQLIQVAKCFVSFDGGLMHFAQAVGTPTFTIFGCTCPNFRIHDWSKARVVWRNQDELHCAGCHHLTDEPVVFTKCYRDKHYCLDGISLNEVITAFEHGAYNQPTKPVKDI
jgi:GT2 family glycosyltransferase